MSEKINLMQEKRTFIPLMWNMFLKKVWASFLVFLGGSSITTDPSQYIRMTHSLLFFPPKLHRRTLPSIYISCFMPVQYKN